MLLSSPSPLDQIIFVLVATSASLIALQILFSLKMVKASSRPVQKLIMALALTSILALVSALELLLTLIRHSSRGT